jgi:hypothetical protein
MYCYVRIHGCATAKLESQRTAGSKTPGKGAAAAGRTKLLLHNCIIGSKRHQGHRRTHGGIRRDTKGTGGYRDTTRTGGHSGGIGRDTKRTGGNNGGIGAGRKATGIQKMAPWAGPVTGDAASCLTSRPRYSKRQGPF